LWHCADFTYQERGLAEWQHLQVSVSLYTHCSRSSRFLTFCLTGSNRHLKPGASILVSQAHTLHPQYVAVVS
jgi:hypothetical protein